MSVEESDFPGLQSYSINGGGAADRIQKENPLGDYSPAGSVHLPDLVPDFVPASSCS